MPLEDFFKYQRKRINPFRGLVIDVPTWTDAHDYHRGQQRLHAAAMHQYGVVAGLEVFAWNPPDNSVVIYPGIAVDPEGNTVVVSEPQRFYVRTEERGTAYVVLEYREIPQDMTQSMGEEKAEPVYILEAYRIVEQRSSPEGPQIELARVAVSGEKPAITDAANTLSPGPNEIDTRYRPLAGPSGRGEIGLGVVGLPGSGGHEEGVSSLVRAICHTTDFRAVFRGALSFDADIRDCDLLCMCGSDQFSLGQDQQTALSSFLDRGGVLFGESCHLEGGEAKAFSQAFAALAQTLGRNLRSVDRGHALFKAHHLFAAAPAGLDGPAMLVEDQGMLYSDGDYGCLWAGGRPDKPSARGAIRDALELGVNIAVYAHQRTQYHARRILAK